MTIYEESKERGISIQKFKNSNNLKNWALVLSLVHLTMCVIENYCRFGALVNPTAVVYQVIYCFIEYWWLYRDVLLFGIMQILQAFIVEKLLVLRIIPEVFGMTLHAFNTFFLPFTYLITIKGRTINIVVNRIVLLYITYHCTKFWSYAYVNSTHRNMRNKKENTNIDNKETDLSIRYPENVTLGNIFRYMVLTPPVQYQIFPFSRGRTDWKKLFKLLFQLFITYCMMALIAMQFLKPELQLLKNQGHGYTQFIKCFIRILLPVHFLWLLYFVQSYRCFFPAYAEFAGMQHLRFHRDWWNSMHLTEFWRKWNLPVHMCLKYNVSLPLIRKGYSVVVANTAAFIIAGIIHEYLNVFSIELYNGCGFLTTLMEIPMGKLTEYLNLRFGNNVGNASVWLYLMITHSAAAIFLGLRII